MANQKNKLKVRDMSAPDEGAYLTKPNAQVDLERRTEEDYEPESRVARVTVNPNPHGQDDYAGTDPIYQNHSTDQNKPLAAQDGPEKVLEERSKKEHEPSKDTAVEDFGQGGKAAKVPDGTGGRTFRTIMPGQEGYDLKKAEEQNGPPLRVYNDEEPSEADAEEGGEGEGEGEESEVPGENRGATTEPPTPPATPGDTSSRAGTKSGDRK